MDNSNIIETGLNDEQVLKSRIEFGNNLLTPPKKASLLEQFLSKFKDPLIIILLAAGILSICISIYSYSFQNQEASVFFEPVGIFIAILLATGLAFIFESQADREFSILNQVNDEEPVKVRRNGQCIEIAKKDVVVGDVVFLETGCEIPADGILYDSVNLQVDESSLTGEPCCFKSADENDADSNATYKTNEVLRGTKVLEGHGIFIVKAVGDRTENGKVYKEAQIDDSVKTPLSIQLDGLGRLITNASYLFAAGIIVGKLMLYFNFSPLSLVLILPVAIFFYLVIFRFRKYKASVCISLIVAFVAVFISMVAYVFTALTPEENFSTLLSYTLQTLMIAVTLIVVAVPEGLPMAVTLSLAYSMKRMLKTNNLVRKLHACETMGATTVICTDKTGTLTQNKMTVSQAVFYSRKDNTKILSDSPSDTLIAEGIAVNSTAMLNGDTVIGNPTEGALLLYLKKNGLDYQKFKDSVKRLAELPFTTQRKFMATLVYSQMLDKKVLYVKGAPEIVLSMCKNIEGNKSQDEVLPSLLQFQSKGMRTLGFAYMEVTDEKDIILKDSVKADNLTFLGIAAISDPVRDEVHHALTECTEAGINIKIVTGDTPATAKEIARQVGLVNSTDSDKSIITGPEFEELDDDVLKSRINELKVIARARPGDKKRLVELLQQQGQVVAVTGDGTNDAPALKAAHVGLSMGDGTSVAKDASDITIIDNSFKSISRAVMWGRSLFKNIQRFVLFQMTVNVAACFVVLCGAFMDTESPLTVTQMLWVNLIMDTFAAMALASLPPSEMVMKEKPRDRNDFIISKAMASSIVGVGFGFFILLLGLLYVFEHSQINSLYDLSSLSTGPKDGLSRYELSLFFTIFVMLQFFNMFNARAFASGQSAFNIKGCRGFIIIIAMILTGQIMIVEFGGECFNVIPLKFSDWVIIFTATSLVLFIGELQRLFFHRINK